MSDVVTGPDGKPRFFSRKDRDRDFDGVPTKKLAVPPPAPKARKQPPRTILVVDPDPMTRALVRRILEQDSYIVVEAEDAHQALEVAKDHKGSLHLVMAAITTSGLPISQLREHLRRLRPALELLFMARSIDDARVRGITDVASIVTMPIHPNTLKIRLKTILDRS